MAEQDFKALNPGYKKGFKLLMISVTGFFTGPLIVHSAFKNTSHGLFLPVILFGVAICFFAVFFACKGLKYIMNALFNKENTPH